MSEVELMIRGQISTLPKEQQEQIFKGARLITEVAKEIGEENWIYAISLLGAKLSA